MNLQNQDVTNNTAEPSPDQLTTAAASRRKFLVRASAASLPVIASVQSGSAWGCVELTCSKGTQTLSTGGSAVASAVANKSTAYTSANKPNWSSLTTITNVVNADYKSYLLTNFTGKTWYSGSSKLRFNQSTNCQLWLTRAAAKVYNATSSTKPIVRAGFTPSALQTAYKNNCQLIAPGFYDPTPPSLAGTYSTNVMWVNGDTALSSIFQGVSDIGSTIGSFASSKYKFVVAAFIGALWERHPEYRLRFPTKPICYPEPQLIVDKFVKSNAEARMGMNRLFEYYTNGTVDGKKVG